MRRALLSFKFMTKSQRKLHEKKKAFFEGELWLSMRHWAWRILSCRRERRRSAFQVFFGSASVKLPPRPPTAELNDMLGAKKGTLPFLSGVEQSNFGSEQNEDSKTMESEKNPNRDSSSLKDSENAIIGRPEQDLDRSCGSERSRSINSRQSNTSSSKHGFKIETALALAEMSHSQHFHDTRSTATRSNRDSTGSVEPYSSSTAKGNAQDKPTSSLLSLESVPDIRSSENSFESHSKSTSTESKQRTPGHKLDVPGQPTDSISSVSRSTGSCWSAHKTRGLRNKRDSRSQSEHHNNSRKSPSIRKKSSVRC